MNEQAADKKAKRNLEYAAAIIMCWTPKEKRDYYLNYFPISRGQAVFVCPLHPRTFCYLSLIDLSSIDFLFN